MVERTFGGNWMTETLPAVRPLKRVRAIMNREDWTLARLGRRIGISRERMRQIVDSDGPPAQHLAAIAASLGVAPDALVDGDGRWRLA